MTPTVKSWIATVNAAAVADPSRPGDEFEITATTGDRDRMNDRVLPGGLDWSHWLKSPSICFAHNYQDIPVAIGTGVRRQGDGWRMRGRWLPGDTFADRVKNAYQQGAINAASIGFRPVEWVKNAFGGTDFLKAGMLEVSLVPIPANPHAIKGMSGDGIAALRAIETELAARARPRIRIDKGEQIRIPLVGAGSSAPLTGTMGNEVRLRAQSSIPWTSTVRDLLNLPPRPDEEILVFDDDEAIDLPCSEAELGQMIRAQVRGHLDALRRRLREGA